MSLVWVTGSSGTGKSTVCALLKARGYVAVDADWEGYSCWVDRVTGSVVVDPPYPVPAGWLDQFGWRIVRERVEALEGSGTVFLCGLVENEAEVRDLFDVVVCLVVDSGTLRRRLSDRTTNAFGRHPEELAATVEWNERARSTYRTIVDAGLPPEAVADAVLAAAGAEDPLT
ncbi:AAA family ATPase [Cryptosporangium sp. NPDC048952]|uniref:AAA family ATPase n=1 Tax=Cryptosporangium sp. NPDC048952 TaxID=3363961 RepID=UPI00371701BE